MTDVGKTCANCGHSQATGDFCEACGTRLPAPPAAPPVAEAAAAGGAAGYGATPAPRPAPAPTPGPAPAPAPTPTPGPAPATPPPYAAPPQYGTPPPGAPYHMRPRGPGFWSRFFDLSFEEFITPSLIKVLFVIAMVVIGLGVLGAIVMGFVSSGALGIFILIAALIGGFFYLLVARVMLEMVVVFFRIRDNTEELAKKKR